MTLTSCGKREDEDYIGRHIIKFPITKTSIGINSVAEFEKTGQFICATSGNKFGSYRNGQLIWYAMIEYGASGRHFSGSGTVVVQITPGDILSANAVSVVLQLFHCNKN